VIVDFVGRHGKIRAAANEMGNAPSRRHRIKGRLVHLLFVNDQDDAMPGKIAEAAQREGARRPHYPYSAKHPAASFNPLL
jgi:hypothetical protein